MRTWRLLLAMAMLIVSVCGVAALAALPSLSDQLRPHVTPLSGAAGYDRLLKVIGDSRFVLLGESTHGTREFYRERAAITRALIEHRGVAAVLFEADWPSMARVDRYVRGMGTDGSAAEALQGFVRFPRWMWRNVEFAEFVDWVRGHNAQLPQERRVRLLGMDLYSFIESTDDVITDLAAAGISTTAAQRRYRCFAAFRTAPDRYGIEAARTGRACERPAEEQVLDLQRLVNAEQAANGAVNPDLFSAYVNARVVKNAELYFRVNALGTSSSWNLRDRHMTDTIDAVAEHQVGTQARLVVWAHNSHQGDAKATDMGKQGEWNVGDLMRRRHGRDVVLVGFTTYTGTVFASRTWGEDGRVRDVRPAIANSVGRLFHDVGVPAFVIGFRDNPAAAALLRQPLWERAIGVQYLPDTERVSHYFRAHLAQQFDAVIHVDTTSALTPLPAP